MKVSKAFILRTSDERSIEYSQACSESCDKVGLKWEYVEGINFDKDVKGAGNDKDILYKLASEKLDVRFPKQPNMHGAAAAATVGHFHIWQRIVNEDICAIILEHDALMLHNVDLDIPDMKLVCLGYKVTDPENYDHQKAGSPQKIEERVKHGGAHAYAITPNTAIHLLDKIREARRISYIDNQYFLSRGQRGDCTLGIVDPIASLGWLRESTIWSKSAVDNYSPILESFNNNYVSKHDLGVKKG